MCFFKLWVQICHGPACKSEGRHCTAPYLSDCKDLFEDALLKAIPKRVILEQSKKRYTMERPPFISFPSLLHIILLHLLRYLPLPATPLH